MAPGRLSIALCALAVPSIAASALAVLCLSAACRSTPPTSSPAPISADTWAVVDGKAITRDAVEKAFRRVGNRPETLSEEETLAAKLGILDDLILEQVLVAKAGELKLEVTEAEVDTAFNETKKNVPEEGFQQELTRRNLTTADVREGIRRQLLAQKVMDREVGAKVSITEQQISDFFNANRAQFNLPEDAFRLGQIIVTPVRDQQITNRTGDDATSPQAANAKVAMLLERLKQGTSFADLARDYSEDPESAPRGGDLGLVPLSAVKQAQPALRDAVLKMTIGNARVVNQGDHYAIVYVVSKETAGQRDLSMPEVKQRISETLRARQEQVLRTAYLSTVRADTEVENYLARRVVEGQGKLK